MICTELGYLLIIKFTFSAKNNVNEWLLLITVVFKNVLEAEFKFVSDLWNFFLDCEYVWYFMLSLFKFLQEKTRRIDNLSS